MLGVDSGFDIISADDAVASDLKALKPHKLGLLHVAIGNANLVKTLFGVKRARIFKHTRIMRGRANLPNYFRGNESLYNFQRGKPAVCGLFHKAFQKQFKIGVVPLVTLLEKVVKRARFQIGRHGEWKS